MIHRYATVGCVGCWAALLAQIACAQAPTLDGLFPLGGQRGATIELVATGAGAERATGLWFNTPGVSAARIDDKKVARFQVTVASDLDAGTYEVCLVSPDGLSNPQRWQVGTLAEMAEDESKSRNDTPALAAAMPLPGVANGRIDPAADGDCYRFEVAEPTPLWIECLSPSLGGQVEAALTVFAPDGREVAHDDGTRAEPLIWLAAEQPGVYVVRVQERAYRKPANNAYRLTVSNQPRLLASFPDLLPAGTTQTVTLYGYLLPQGKPVDGAPPGLVAVSTRVTAPKQRPDDAPRQRPAAGALVDEFRYVHADWAGEAWFGWTDQAVVVEDEPANNRPDTAPLVALPAVVNGQLFDRVDQDWLRVELKKDQTLYVDAWAERLGRDIDLDVVIHDAQGRTLATLADTAAVSGRTDALAAATLDPTGTFKAPADGEYRIIVRDLYGSSLAGPGRTYQLRLDTAPPAGRVVALLGPADKLAAVNVKPGGKVSVQLVANGFAGRKESIVVRAVDLPAGITADEATFDAKTHAKTLTLSADKNAPPSMGWLQLVAEPQTGDQPAEMTTRAATPLRGRATTARLLLAAPLCVPGQP